MKNLGGAKVGERVNRNCKLKKEWEEIGMFMQGVRSGSRKGVENSWSGKQIRNHVYSGYREKKLERDKIFSEKTRMHWGGGVDDSRKCKLEGLTGEGTY